MGSVADVYWDCPGCGSQEKAQAYWWSGDPDEFPVKAVPASRGLSWNPPCSVCGRFKLTMPEVLVECIAVPVERSE